jgi:signal peptidase I
LAAGAEAAKLSAAMTEDASKRARELATIRDTFESIWVAIVLAFVLRAFMFEAFVIPTGSMAPRLMGEHWDLRCPACGREYAYGVPKENTEYAAGPQSPKAVPSGARCPSCGWKYPADRAEFRHSGDRVLVLKYLYHFRDPQRWDVVVFKNPQDNRQNYIKRLIGLPGETVEIVHGDIFVSSQRGGPRAIQRKPRKAQEAMWQVVYDNDYPPVSRADFQPPQWAPDGPDEVWALDAYQGRRMHYRGGRPGRLRLHAPPHWFLPRYGYNPWPDERDALGRKPKRIDPERDVCTDLKLSAVMVPRSARATVVLQTTSFGKVFLGEVGADGRAALTCPALQDRPIRRRIEPFRIGQGRQIALTYVDFCATLWVDDEPVIRVMDNPKPSPYAWLTARMADGPVPPPELAIAASGGECELWHVKVMRDVYYTDSTLQKGRGRDWEGPRGDYARQINEAHDEGKLTAQAVRHRRVDLDADPPGPGWGTMGRPISLAKAPEDHDDPDLDEFFCLGDNSPQSLDGRGWLQAAPTLRLTDRRTGEFIYQLGTVPRYNMIGRALLVYWPAGFRIPGLDRFPIIPNVGQMRLIR